MLRFLTAGESHGPELIAILDGMPAGLRLNIEQVNCELARRQQGYGRSSRQRIESDCLEIASGMRHGITSGAPLALVIKNKDWESWQHVMSPCEIDSLKPAAAAELEKRRVNKFRPGHADLAGTLKYRLSDIRDVIERASARETAARVAAGAVCEQLLAVFGIKLAAHVVQVGSVKAPAAASDMDLSCLEQLTGGSAMFCADAGAGSAMQELVKSVWGDGDSLGGAIEILADGLPVGLGTYTQWDGRLDGQLAQGLMSVQAIKAVEIGDALSGAALPGSAVHDAILPAPASGKDRDLPFKRASNHAGGLEGGMTNGERLVLRAYMKPIPTLRNGLPSVTYPDFKAAVAHFERADVCAIAAASVVCKAMVAFVLARAFIDKFGGDTLADMQFSFNKYLEHCRHPAGNGRLNANTNELPACAGSKTDLEASLNERN